MKSRLLYIDANETNGSALAKCHYVYDVVRGGTNFECRIPGHLSSASHLTYLRKATLVKYHRHSVAEKIKEFFGL